MPTDPKKLAHVQRWRDANREKVRENNREYYQRTIEKRRASARASRERNLASHLERQRAYAANRRATLRQKVIEHFGGKCARCGFSDWRALQVDHINGGGTKERNASRGWQEYYAAILADNEGKYQLLCANCNQIKRYELTEHTTRRRPFA